ncbi:hypothetical protein EDC01DRAFT_778706 [Geopyxis carbonaria]|nr:hypothetical protein EDC01DRAFT_778706 [Geopyxis carbonaria]
MQFPQLFLMLLPVLSSTYAWHMTTSFDDGTSLKFDGHTNSHCKRFKKSNAGINNVYFEGSSFADTFELFSDTRCKSLVFKGKKGSNNVPDEEYGSYKVY